MKTYLGCDPGQSGGIGVITPAGGQFGEKMPETDRDLFDFFSNLCRTAQMEGWGIFAVLEQVHSMPGQGVSSSFKFGMGYGALRMALIASNIPFELVTPQKWQKALGCLTGGQKNVSKQRAQQLFPQIKINHAIADALLLAEYCKRTYP